MPEQPYVDPGDLQFGKAAADKADELDRAERAGRPPHEVGGEPGHLRPGGKAEPITTDQD